MQFKLRANSSGETKDNKYQIFMGWAGDMARARSGFICSLQYQR
jgi:hypothetical protein